MLTYPSILAIADAVKSDLNAHFPGLNAVRENLPRVAKEDLETRKVTVVPTTRQATRTNRGDTDKTYGIDIGIQQTIEAEPAAGAVAEDDLIRFAEETLDWFMDEQKVLTAYSAGEVIVFIESATLINNVPFDPETKRVDCVFHAVVRLTLRALVS